MIIVLAISFLAACDSDSKADSADTSEEERVLSAPVPGPLVAEQRFADELYGKFEVEPDCGEPNVALFYDVASYEAGVASICSKYCPGSAIDWSTEVALVAWVGCGDLAGRTLRLNSGEVQADASVDLAYTLITPDEMHTGDVLTAVYAIHAVPAAAYGELSAAMERIRE